MSRGIEERLAYFRQHPPGRPGRCAESVWRALGVPPLGAASASIAAGKIRHAGKLHTSHNAPRGSVLLFTGGSHGYGHAMFALGGGRALTTDPPHHPGGVGEVSGNYPEVAWGHHWAGWTTWWGVDLPGATSVAVISHDDHPHVKLANLHYGARNADVKALQRALRVAPVSGFYGPTTDAAVRAEQRRAGEHPDDKGHSFVGARQAVRLGLIAV